MDTTTFHDLYTAHAREVFVLARYLTGDGDAATDIVSETFVRAWAGRDALRLPTARAYLLAIARNLARDYHRTNVRRAGGDVPETPVPAGADARLALSRVLEALDRLPTMYREPLTLAAAGLSSLEIARALNLTLSAAKVRVHRARILLAAATGAGTKEAR